MADWNCEVGTVWTIDASQGTQQQYRQVIGEKRWHLVDFRKVEPAFEALRSDLGPLPDILFINTDMEHGVGRALVNALRSGEFGDVGLIPVVAVTSDHDNRTLQRLMHLGIDGILFLPLSNLHIEKTLSNVVSAKRVYIATADYIGPDRRAKQERTGPITPIGIPRLLQARLEGKPFDEPELRRKTWNRLLSQRVRSDVFSVLVQVNIAFTEAHNDHIHLALKRIAKASRDGEAKALDTDFGGARESFGAMADLAEAFMDMADPAAALTYKEKALAEALCDALRRSVIPDISAEELAKMIRQEVNAWLAAQARIKDYRDEALAADV